MSAAADKATISPPRNENDSEQQAQLILDACHKLIPTIRNQRDRIEQERQLPADLVQALKNAGVFRMTMPRAWGGAELDPMSQLQIIETLAYADASVGWCAMIGCDGGYFSSFIDQQVAREIYSDIDTVTAAALTATGHAIKTEGGYRVQGRFPFSSGCRHSDWFVLGCQVYDGDTPQFFDDGKTPITLQCFVPAAAVSIQDTWFSTGLRGSGSHDLEVTDCFVPAARTFSYQNLKFYRSGALYCFPLNIIFKFSSVPLGVAQAALDTLIAAGTKPSRKTTVDGKITSLKTLRDEAFVQDAVGRAAAMIGSARSYLYTTIKEVWTALESQQEMSPQLFADFQMINTHVYESCASAVELIYKTRGGSAVYSHGELDRHLRDILTMNQHVMNSLRSYTSGGCALLGIQAEQILL